MENIDTKFVSGSDNKKCTCGHFKNEHLWEQEFEPNHMVGYELIGKFHSTSQEDRGLCKKCTCPKYKSPSRFRPKYIEYPERPINDTDVEKRCSRCGRLLSNHTDIDHPFQETN